MGGGLGGFIFIEGWVSREKIGNDRRISKRDEEESRKRRN
jgi:hypothetical protein